MQIQKISSVNQSKNKQVSFKNRITEDIGASDPRGSLKILVQDNNGKDLFEYKGFVNDSTKGFESNDDFVKKMAKTVNVESLIRKDIEGFKNKIKNNHLTEEEHERVQAKLEDLQASLKILQGQSKEEKKITGLALLLPGTIQNHTALFMANLRKTDKTSLIDVNLDDIITEIKNNGEVELADNLKFMPSKDLAGTGLGVTAKLLNHPEYGDRVSKGFHAVIVQTGGGFGSVNVKVKTEDEIDIETDECSHDLYHDKKTNTEVRLGKLGASTSSVIENFAREMEISEEDAKALVQTGLAQIATQSSIKLNKEKDAAAIKVLLNTGLYETTNEKTETIIVKVKDNETDMRKFEDASKYAVAAYADALAAHAVTRITRGANLYILSGPLAMGLNATIEEKPHVYGSKNMRELILKKINKRVGNDVTCNILRRAHNFDVVCDKTLSVDNNTSGGSLLLDNNASTFTRRGEWLRVEIGDIKKNKD